MTRRVLRFEVPVDDQWHAIRLRRGLFEYPIHVAARRPDVVEFWIVQHDEAPTTPRYFRAYGTGQPDVKGDYIGTALAADGALVWHLFEDLTR